MQNLLSNVTSLLFITKVGDVVEKEHVIGVIGAQKLNTDIITPVSGKIVQLNAHAGTLPEINVSPYNDGWLAVIQLTKPSEMEELIGPYYYTYLQAVFIPPTAPPMRS